MTDDLFALHKSAIRTAALAVRKSQPDKDNVSKRITDRVLTTAQYRSAKCVLWYVDVRDEVRTRHSLLEAIASPQKIVVPYCMGNQLALFHLETMDELEPGKFKILEPRAELRGLTEKRVATEELDLVIVPGVAFDRNGGRIGHGKGYYDKLLQNVRDDSLRVGLAFECQIVDIIPKQSHDVPMDAVVTENSTYKDYRRARKEEN